MHHVYDVNRLRTAYFALKRDAAAGIDGETWKHYGEALEDHLCALTARLTRGAFRASPVRRAFPGFSYGFRPKRSPHQALDALTGGIETRRVNWVLDADIRGFFDTLNHEWLVRFLEHRVADRRVVRLIQKWLRAGVLEDGQRTRSDVARTSGDRLCGRPICRSCST